MSAPATPRDDALLDQAGEWLLRLSEDELPPEAVAEWLEWYHADSRHRETFHRLQADYEQLKAIPPATKHAMAVTPPPRPATLLPSRPRMGLEESRVGRRVALAMAACLIAVVGVLAWQNGSLRLPREAEAGTYQTARAVNQLRTLPDGSRLTLGGASAASWRFTGDVRHVVLESGEGYFEVAKDRHRPFIVSVGGMTVRAVGTAFNIRRARERVEVTVAEGIVDVHRTLPDRPEHVPRAAPEAPLRLSAGQAVVLAPSPRQTQPQQLTVKRANPEAATAWQTGRFEFVDEPLASVIATVNRYAERDIVITQSELGSLTLTGSVMNGHIDEWLQSLEKLLPVEVVLVSDSTALLGPAE
jgi:transmembrane sensor